MSGPAYAPLMGERPNASTNWVGLLAAAAGCVCVGAMIGTMAPHTANLWAPAATTVGHATMTARSAPVMPGSVGQATMDRFQEVPMAARAVQYDEVAPAVLPSAASKVGESPAFYATLFGLWIGTVSLALRAWTRSNKHHNLAMAAMSGERSRVSTALKAEVDPAMTTGTPVPKKTMLVVGATGTVGRQIVRQALDAGYDVRCLVRPRQNPADFLRDWGAKTVSGNLSQPKTLPAALVGVHTVIDVATARPEESIREVDWAGKKALITAAKAMGIQRYIFFSIVDCDKSPDVALMDVKRCTEMYLQQVGLNYTVLRACGFMQALIQQYAVPMLEGEEVYGTQDKTRIAYLNTEDAARMTLACLQKDATIGKTLTLAGPKSYTVSEVIERCEKLGGMEAQVNNVPTGLLGVLRRATSLFAWSKEVSDRLSFSELLSNDKEFSAPMDETYELLGLDPNDTQTLDEYLNEYYRKMLGRLKEVKARSGQRGIYL